MQALVSVQETTDGAVLVRVHRELDAEAAAQLRRALVHVIRRVRPHRMVVDLDAVDDLDSVNAGTLAAGYQLGADHDVVVTVQYRVPQVGRQLRAAGMPHEQLHHR
jgi:anti-anti-sigma factor